MLPPPLAGSSISSYRGRVKDLLHHLLPVDQSRLVDQLVRLSEQNSWTYNLDGLATTLDMLGNIFDSLGGSTTRLPVADHVEIDDRGHPHAKKLGEIGSICKWPSAPIQLLLVGHYDTVFSPEHPFQTTRTDGDRLIGPGTADMKGGLLVMHAALSTLEASPWAGQVGWEVLLTPDEEIGSPGSAPMLAAAASDKAAGFIFEPSFPDGSLASERKGSGTFNLHVSGVAAHAGRDHHSGRNAVMAAARLACALDDLNGHWEGVTVNVGAITGGGPTNIVPDSAVVRLNVRVPTGVLADEFQRTVESIAAAASTEDGITVTSYGTFTRRPKELTPGIQALLDAAKQSAAAIGFDLHWAPTGGVSDGNNLAAAGLPNLDNLGVHGGNIHSDAEFVYPDSLASRAGLAGLLLLMIASGALEVPR